MSERSKTRSFGITTRRVLSTPQFEPHILTSSPGLATTRLVANHVNMTRIVDLPLEILLEILTYNAIAQNRLPVPLHPLNALALTNKHLHTVVEEYCRNRLKKYANFTPPKSKTFSCRKKWLAETCQFCKRKSQRRAILYASLTCCRMCDKQYFPKMVCGLPNFPALFHIEANTPISDNDTSP